MSLSLPYFRNRRYLTGIDWFIAALAKQSARRNNGIGGRSQLVLSVDGALSETTLRGVLNQIADRFPLIHGRVARDWMNLAPYWKVQRRSGEPVIPLQLVDLAADETDRADQLFSEHLNSNSISKSRHLQFLLVRLGQRQSRLGMVFDHSLLDAFGAEMFFGLIDQTWQGHLDEISPLVRQTEPAHLDQWMRRLRSGRALNRLLIRLGRQDTCALQMPPRGTSRLIRTVHESLSREESANLNHNADEEIGVPVLLPSAVARALFAMRDPLSASSRSGSQYMVFTSVNLRPPAQQWESLFFNHFSLMPFAVGTDLASSVKEMAIALRDQFFERMKAEIPLSLQEVTTLGRICPLWLASWLLGFVAKGRACSFYFACLKDVGCPLESFLGQPTRQLIHQPLVFSPPGFNICMTEFRGCYNLVISYLDGVVDDSAAKLIMRDFKSALLEPATNNQQPLCVAPK